MKSNREAAVAGELGGAILDEGVSPARVDMDGDLFTFLRNHIARPADAKPTCDDPHEGATCCLSPAHGGPVHAGVTTEAKALTWPVMNWLDKGLTPMISTQEDADRLFGKGSSLAFGLFDKRWRYDGQPITPSIDHDDAFSVAAYDEIMAFANREVDRIVCGTNASRMTGGNLRHNDELMGLDTRPTKMEPGQVWDLKGLGVADGRYVVIDLYEVNELCANLRADSGEARHVLIEAAVSQPKHAQCSGFEMPDRQRIMVGEFRASTLPGKEPWKVAAILDGARVLLAKEGTQVEESVEATAARPVVDMMPAPGTPEWTALMTSTLVRDGLWSELAKRSISKMWTMRDPAPLHDYPLAPVRHAMDSRVMRAECASSDVQEGEQDRRKSPPDADSYPAKEMQVTGEASFAGVVFPYTEIYLNKVDGLELRGVTGYETAAKLADLDRRSSTGEVRAGSMTRPTMRLDRFRQDVDLTARDRVRITLLFVPAEATSAKLTATEAAMVADGWILKD